MCVCVCVQNYGGTNGHCVHHYPYQMVLVRAEAQLETTLICTCPEGRGVRLIGMMGNPKTIYGTFGRKGWATKDPYFFSLTDHKMVITRASHSNAHNSSISICSVL